MKGVVFLTTTARHGHVRTPAALQRFLKKQPWPLAVATAEQVHQPRVAVVPRLPRAKEYPGADGLLTDVPGQPLGIFTADCVPIFLSAPAQGVVGVLHAGWRGAQQRILAKALRILWKRWRARAQDISIVLGPAIGGCCFGVGWDVARYFPTSRRRRGSRWTVDLPQVIRHQAEALGIPRGHIRTDAACTRHTRKYFSYRRDKTEKRQASLIMKRKGD